jgi:hypothetical protein
VCCCIDRSRPPVGQYHFAVSRGLTPTVTFVAALVPSILVAPKENAGLLPEAATGLLSGGDVVELLDGSLLQPTITMVAAKTPAITVFLIKRHSAQPYQISNPASLILDCQPERHRRVRRIWFGILILSFDPT